jgi:O-antigen/teichoic acid export membrane protein
MTQSKSNIENNKRIAKNTLALYIRMFFSLLVSLYTARVILNTLGVADYGIHNVVAGVVTMFGFINAAMATGTQRFLTFELGKGDIPQLKRVFSMSLNIHIIIALLIFVLAETLGLWFLNTKMVIPPDRMIAANWVYQLSIISAMLSITQVPYTASLMAHERFGVYAYVGIVEVVLRLVIVYLLVLIAWDKLILYSVLSFCVASGVVVFYRYYCKSKFEECTYHFEKNKVLFKTLIGFSGWSLLGNLSHILLTQGMNILINIFFGVAVNAARAITVQVETAINSFVTNFMVALNPQITKNYATHNFDEMKILMERGAKFSFSLFFLLALPVFIEVRMILKLWLNIVPEYTVIFIRLNLIVVLIYTLTNTYLTGILATGNIKRYQLKIAIMVAVLYATTIFLLNQGFSPEITYIVYIAIALFVFIFRISAIKRLMFFSIRDYFKNVVLKAIFIVIVSIPIPFLLNFYLQPNLLRIVVVTISSVLISLIGIYVVGLNNPEKKMVTSFALSKLKFIK